MIGGRIDSSGRALLRVSVKAAEQSTPIELEAWIDTGFTGELVLPQDLIASLHLKQSGTVSAELGDGSAVVMETYHCLVAWFGRDQAIEVVGNSGSLPLLGIGLMRDHKLTIDYLGGSLSIE